MTQEDQHRDEYREGRNGGKIKKPWAPGQSGNPTGRRKGSLNLKTVLIKLLDEGDGQAAERVMRTLVERAQAHPQDRDSVWLGAVRTILDRIDGPINALESAAEQPSTTIAPDPAPPPGTAHEADAE